MTAARLLPAATLCVLLCAGSALAGGDLNKALRAAKEAIKADDSAALASALPGVVAEGGKNAAKGLIDLLDGFPKDSPQLYWQVVGAITSLNDPKGLDAIGDYLARKGDAPAAEDILFGLQNNRSAAVLSVYQQILKKKGSPLRLLVVDRLGEQERPEAVDLLMDLFEKEAGSGSALEHRIRSTLGGLFNEDMGDYLNWKGWWEQNRETAFSKKDTGGTTGTVKDELDAARAGGLQSSARRGGRVIVLRGMNKNFDQIEKMLARLEVKHEVLLKEDFMKDVEASLKGTAVLILNCNFFGNVCRCPTCKPGINPKSRLPQCTGCDKHDSKGDKLSDVAVERIKKFVDEGGSVFTEDFGLKELTSRAWPDLVAVGTDLKSSKVDYAPVPGQAGSPLLRGVMARPGADTASMTRSQSAEWKVDDLSPAIKIVDPTKVRVLLASDKVKDFTNDPTQGAVAITFSPGETVRPSTGGKKHKRSRGGSRSRGSKDGGAGTKGIVLHVLSHFGKQGTKQDEFTLQNLLVNFLLEAQERYTTSRSSSK